ncbi:MAG: hypothetical protein VKO64_09575 [Candidatus Sericytochromatia bacterium]|nr:hypothetical protein [Candidatus Sericytochromatia bacterium]
MTRRFDPGDRTYLLSDARLEAFRKLTPEQRLAWVEQLAAFPRLARLAREGSPPDTSLPQSSNPAPEGTGL